MRMFKEIPASKKSLAPRKPIYGVGINDAGYITSLRIDGKLVSEALDKGDSTVGGAA